MTRKHLPKMTWRLEHYLDTDWNKWESNQLNWLPTHNSFVLFYKLGYLLNVFLKSRSLLDWTLVCGPTALASLGSLSGTAGSQTLLWTYYIIICIVNKISRIFVDSLKFRRTDWDSRPGVGKPFLYRAQVIISGFAGLIDSLQLLKSFVVAEKHPKTESKQRDRVKFGPRPIVGPLF